MFLLSKEQCSVLLWAVLYSTEQYSAVQCSAEQSSAVQHSLVQFSAVQCSTVNCSALQFIVAQYNTVRYFTVQCSTVRWVDAYLGAVFLEIRESLAVLLGDLSDLGPGTGGGRDTANRYTKLGNLAWSQTVFLKFTFCRKHRSRSEQATRSVFHPVTKVEKLIVIFWDLFGAI